MNQINGKSGLQVFDYSDNKVRIIMKNGEPWFVLKDVCNILGIGNNRDVVARLDDDEKGVDNIDTLGGAQKLIIISESGFYKVIMLSRKPEAKRFQRWVTHEVLPSIRQHGAYVRSGLKHEAQLWFCSG
jgi:prophage antirepressor-like protein